MRRSPSDGDQLAAIKSQGMFFSPISGDRKLPTCATRDIATVAAKLEEVVKPAVLA